MRLAIISDIHGNMEAFTAVLSDMEQTGVDDVICLGDNIGYGPEPCEVIECLRSRSIVSVMGNHELAVCDPVHSIAFNPYAKISIEKTIALLPDEDKAYIRRLPLFLNEFECRFVHGFPPDSAEIYLFQMLAGELTASFSEFSEGICFVGHTHQLEIIDFDGQKTVKKRLEKGILHLDKSRRYIINIGSVGQPRDGNNNAKYAIFDTSPYTLDIRFVPYDIGSVVDKLLKGGWPEIHAMRLW